jgi:hypothetical protein
MRSILIRRPDRHPHRHASRRRLTAALVACVAVLGVLATAPAASATTVRTIHPGDDVLAAFRGLAAGDTLLLAAGTYNIGLVRVTGMASGGASNPITITAADPAHPPLLVGGLSFYSPNYVVLRSLRIQGAVATYAGLTMVGGTGWVVDQTEVFGAAKTGALGNVVITGTGGYPRAFAFSQNCVHDAGVGPAGDATHHNIYVDYAGSATTSGNIFRNLIWNATSGENIKVGNGGVAGALGPWNLRIANNTFGHAGRQILLHANVVNTTIVGNLFYYATQGFVASPQTTQIYMHDVIGTGNSVSHSYWFASTMFNYDPSKKLALGTDIVRGPDPAFLGAYTCGTAGWRQTLPAALPYGRWGNGAFPR